MQKSKAKKKKDSLFSFFPLILLEVIRDDSTVTLLSYSSSVLHRILISLTRVPKVGFHQHVALSWMRLLPRGQCYFATVILCLSPGFPEFFLGDTHMYLSCYTCRLFSEAERGSAQSFHKSTFMNQREDSDIHTECSKKEDGGKPSVAEVY